MENISRTRARAIYNLIETTTDADITERELFRSCSTLAKKISSSLISSSIFWQIFYCMLIVPHTRHARHRERELVMHPANWMLWTVILWRSHVELCLVVWTSWRVGKGNSQLVEKCKLLRGFELHSIFFRPDKQNFHTITSDSGPGECAIKLDWSRASIDEI